MEFDLMSITTEDVQNVGYHFVEKIRFLFYMVNPYETMYPEVKFVPRYVVEVSDQEW